MNEKGCGGESLLERSRNLALEIGNILYNKKATDVVILDVHDLTVISDYFVIASGQSETQVVALYEEIRKQLEEQGMDIKHLDGVRSRRWIVIDYGDVIVHIFHHEERKFYNLERLWADAEPLLIDTI